MACRARRARQGPGYIWRTSALVPCPMWRSILELRSLLLLIAVWVAISFLVPPLLYAVLPISVVLLYRAERWQELFMGFLICLVLSDMNQDITGMLVMKTAKYTYIVALAAILLLDRARLQPFARIFPLFLPFFFFCLFPILRSPVPVLSAEKTLSYALIFFVAPNMVLANYRRYGWDFFRNLIWFIMLVLTAQKLMPWVAPEWWSYIGDRFRGLFGNPNGLAIFTYLTFVLFAVINHLHNDLFSTPAKVFVYAVLTYYVITCGARTSLMSTLMFVLFVPFFRFSFFLGLISFFAFLGISELLAANLPAILTALGLQEYMRVDTLQSGSGRYFAWQYAWEKIQQTGIFLFGAGFEYEGWVMYQGRNVLERLGHQGGVHNTYLAFWLNTGITGLFLFFRGIALVFIKATKNTAVSMAILFSVLFSILYESWLAGSLNPYTILFLVILTIISEEEIVGEAPAGAPQGPEAGAAQPPPLVLPAR